MARQKKKMTTRSAANMIKKLKIEAGKEIATIKKATKKQIADIKKTLAKKIIEHKKTPKIVKVGAKAASKAKRTYKKAVRTLKGE